MSFYMFKHVQNIEGSDHINFFSPNTQTLQNSILLKTTACSTGLTFYLIRISIKDIVHQNLLPANHLLLSMSPFGAQHSKIGRVAR